jgi:RNA recognition motif-containing protein
MNIHISNLSQNVIDSDIRKMFSAFGEVTMAVVNKDKWNGRPRGTATVDMVNDQQAEKAILSLNKSKVDGKTILVSENKYSVKDYLV